MKQVIKVRIFLLISLIGLLTLMPGFAQETPEPILTPTPTGTCLPCVDTITIGLVSYMDDFGVYSDNDGYPDPGEIIGITVPGSSHDRCCFTDGNPSINISTDYQYVQYLGKNRPGSVWATYYYYIKPDAPCLGNADFHIQGRVAGTGPEAYDYKLLSVPIGVDDDGTGGFTCDTKYAHIPLLNPVILEAENADTMSGISDQGSYIDSCDSEDWIVFNDIAFGPGIFYKYLEVRLAAGGTSFTGTIEMRLESRDGVLIGSLDVIGTGSVSTFLNQSVLINAFSGIHDLYLVFKDGQNICRLDSVTLGPEPPFSYIQPPGPDITPGATPTPAPTIDPSLPLADFTVMGHLYGIGDSQAIEVSGSTVYTGFVDEYNNNNSGLLVLDTSDPGNPVPVSMIPLPGFIADIKALDTFLYVAEANIGMHIIDVTDIHQPFITSTFPCSPGNYSHIAVENDTLYCATASTDLLIVDVSDKAHPVLLSTFTDERNIQNISINGDIAYVSVNSYTYTPYAKGIIVLDISDPVNPVPLHSIETLRSKGIASLGDYLFCGLEGTGPNDGALQVYSITDRALPVFLGEIRLPGRYVELGVRNNYVYCANPSNELYVIDVSDKASPSLFTKCWAHNPDLAVDAEGSLYSIGSGRMKIITTITDHVNGDVNGDGTIDIVDALLVAQYYVDLSPANFNAAAADVNCDGSIDIIDALLIAQYYVDLINQLC